jgi:hypothetical protein
MLQHQHYNAASAHRERASQVERAAPGRKLGSPPWWRSSSTTHTLAPPLAGVYVSFTAELLREAAALDAGKPSGVAADGWEPLLTTPHILRATLSLPVSPRPGARAKGSGSASTENRVARGVYKGR